jgi:hypothetical protein
MHLRTYHSRLFALLPALALAAYGVVGVFGHALHGLLPCGDGDCGSAPVTADGGEHHECCCHHQAASNAVTESDGPQYRTAGHDADDCSLCLLLAKIKVSRQVVSLADFSVASSYHEPIVVSELLAAEFDLSGAPRGPPLA